MAQLPQGEPAPESGELPPQVREGARRRGFGVYIHVPYCRVRCGYCDFNTYTAEELGTTSQAGYAGEAIREISFADGVLRGAGVPARPVQSVFFGGGTPTLLPARDLAAMLHAVRDTWGLDEGAEITTEANPDSVDREALQTLREAGFTRVSFGMQSAQPHVLRVLDRTHTPERVPQVVAWAHEVGLETSLDLIYGAPGESLADWDASLEAAIACRPGHISAYALIVEPGTKLAVQIRRGEIPAPDDDLQADMYERADQRLRDSGYHWYEISNWARSPEQESIHNRSYWRGDDWWGIGPGAHSHVGGVRWWNVKHPRAYADRIGNGLSPALEREVLDDRTRMEERLLLETRTRDGISAAELHAAQRAEAAAMVGDGLIDSDAWDAGRVSPTLRGRLLADTVIHRLLAAGE